MAAEAKLDFFVLRSVEGDGAILNERETMPKHCMAFHAVNALLPWKSR
jgi:hypothetical protein